MKSDMKDIDAILHSEYIIDGIRMDATPAQMLSECMTSDDGTDPGERQFPPVVDEPSDPAPGSARFSMDGIYGYLDLMRSEAGTPRTVPAEFSGQFTRMSIARTLIDALWKEGHFSLEDIRTEIRWEWDCTPVGNMAAFYFSAEAASQYLYDLGVHLSGYSMEESSSGNRVSLTDMKIRHEVLFTEAAAEDPEPVVEDGCQDAAEEYPEYSGTEKDMPRERKCPETAAPDNKSWLIYIPFDTCAFKLGGSLLCSLLGSNGDNAPDVKDPDYFIDCFEVLRELVEDGVVVSGTTVSDGGLITAADRMCRKTGCTIDIKGIESAYMEKDAVRLLFAEVPGVLVQIRDSDYDYVDSQLLLQEIAYYPLGHPDPSSEGVKVSEGGRPDVFSILSALLNGQASEGED